jgi:hypothetical protein
MFKTAITHLKVKGGKNMYYRKSIIRFAIAVSVCAVIILGLSPLNSANCAEQVYDVTACVSGTRTVLAQSAEITTYTFDLKGIMRSNIENKILDNFTVHSQGVVVIEGKNTTVYCLMKYLAPDGDYVIFRYTQNPGETSATTTILLGTGKWKGITGGGKAIRITRGKPVAAGTVQLCNNHKGTFTVPK